jgi:hypothetical protein
MIREHLIERIEEETRFKMKSLGYDGLLFLEDFINDSGYFISRFDYKFVYSDDKYYPLIFDNLDNSTLLELYKRIKYNYFYYYRMVDGKTHKIRIKNWDTTPPTRCLNL